MARFNKVKIGANWLTSDAAETGVPCKLAINNLDLLLMDKTGSYSQAADGTAFIQLADVHGVELTVTVSRMKKALYEALVADFNTANNTGAKLELLISGSTGNFTIDCFVHPKNPISPASFVNDLIRDVAIRLITE